MLNLPSIFDILSKVDTYPVEDFVDRLNFGATVYLLAFFVLITGSKQHFGNPIQCMAPPESPDSWVHYYHDYCYIQDKLRIFDMNVRKSIEYEARQRAGADYTPIGRFHKEDSSRYWSPRVMYYQLLSTVLTGSDDPNTGIFPRIVLCDVARFALANLHQEHMQCVLMLNFINEKIYTFLWFWIVFVAIASTFSAIRYTAALFLPIYRGLIADNFLPTQDVLFSNAAAEHGVRPTPVASRALVDYFVHKVLRCDGVLLLSFVNVNAGGLVTHDIAHQLWKITVQPTFKGSSSPPDECETEKKVPELYWPSFTNLPSTMRKMGLAKRMEAAGDRDVSFNDKKQFQTAQPMVRTRSLSVGNLEAEPSAPIESSPLISDGSTQAVEDSTCPIQSLPASPGTNRRRLANTGPGVALIDNRYGRK
ncbi:Innexin [Necator americanus]|uniref:Innexin n=1 Tax=Necator americanus TaxID=51031 RepID=W2TTQ8_NECAM|nr:Innexin [Necator americanus]ETN84437.1 Innexin [Necator americanus]